jgi:hypothetical protein
MACVEATLIDGAFSCISQREYTKFSKCDAARVSAVSLKFGGEPATKDSVHIATALKKQ